MRVRTEVYLLTKGEGSLTKLVKEEGVPKTVTITYSCVNTAGPIFSRPLLSRPWNTNIRLNSLVKLAGFDNGTKNQRQLRPWHKWASTPSSLIFISILITISCVRLGHTDWQRTRYLLNLLQDQLYKIARGKKNQGWQQFTDCTVT